MRAVLSRISGKWSIYTNNGKRRLRDGLDTLEDASKAMSEIARARKKGA